MGNTLDLKSIIMDLRSQLSLASRIGFLCGAGTSMALGVPGVRKLSSQVEESLTAEHAGIFHAAKASIQDIPNPTVEDVLNQIRLIRQVTRESKDNEYAGISGVKARELDGVICSSIYSVISEKETGADLTLTKRFVSWINWAQKESPCELFTTNYDLLFERAFEGLQVPYFDGFVGAREPFFLPESIDPRSSRMIPPPSWTRLWKLHGSLGWFWQGSSVSTSSRVVRLGAQAKQPDQQDELVIYPSRDKYESSRKQPFTAFFDRMRNCLLNGEMLFLVTGFSFSDEHINEILYSSLRMNNRLHIVALCHSDEDLRSFAPACASYPNVTGLSPTLGLSRGCLGSWQDEQPDSAYWSVTQRKLTLGDFHGLVQFLVGTSSHKESMEKEVIQ